MRDFKLVSMLVLVSSMALVACSSGSGGGSASNNNDDVVISGHGESCRDFIRQLPADFYYGWVSVPENYENPSQGPQLQIFYYGRRGNYKSHAVFFNGGPGADSHYNYILFDGALNTFGLPTDQVGFVYIDQRGNGCSSPYPKITSTADIVRDRFYGSTGIVYDAEAVRHALFGDQKWKVFGQSYGAFIVHRYVSLFPDSISQAYAHANAINADPLFREENRIYSQYRVMEIYYSLYPDDRARFATLAKLLANSSYCMKNSYGIEYCGVEIGEIFTDRMGFSNRWPRIHERMQQIVPQPDTVEATELQNMIDDYTGGSETRDYTRAMSVIGLYDRNTLVTGFDGCSQVFTVIQRDYRVEQSLMPFSECSPAVQQKYSAKITLETRAKFVKSFKGPLDHLTMSAFVSGLARLGTKRFYLYSGERDIYVPKENFSEELNATKDLLVYRHFMTSGHEGFYTERQVLTDLLQPE